jgi:hypothetical protein
MDIKPSKEAPATYLTSTLSPQDDSAYNGSASARLEEMGYKEELTRSLGMVSVLGLSFAIMAVPFGTSTTLNIALTDGGPVTILWGVSEVCGMSGQYS